MKTNLPLNRKNLQNILSAELIRREGMIEVKFPYNPNLIEEIKTFPGRKWNKENKSWRIPVDTFVCSNLQKLGFVFGRKLNKWISIQKEKVPSLSTNFSVPGLRIDLYPFQKEGIQFLEQKKGRAIIGDEMGLGKTIQALGWIHLNKKTVLPALIICPSSLKLNWAREALKFTDLEPVIIEGKNKKKFTTFPGGNRQDIYIVNYDIIHESITCPICNGTKKQHGIKCNNCKGKGKLYQLNSQIKDLNIKTIVFDESHYLKNPSAGRTIAAEELTKSASHVIPMSGTPIVNRPIEYYGVIRMVNKHIIPDWWQFTKRYCDRKWDGYGWNVTGASNKKEFHKLLTQSIMIRRLKKDVLKDLPPLIRTVVPLEIDLNKYEKILSRIREELKENEAEHLAVIEKAKQLTAELKMDLALEWIENYIESGEKLIVFGEHHTILEKVFEHFQKAAVLVYGNTSLKDRQAAVDRFQNDPECKVFIGSRSAKEGITLTAAHATCFLELWWTPGEHDQAEARPHRIGQEADSVTAYYLLAAGTIEEDIAELLDNKRKILAAILDGKKVDDINLLSALLQKITKEN